MPHIQIDLSMQHENRPLSYCASMMIQEQTIGSSGSVSLQFFILCLGENIIGNLWVAVIFSCLKWCKEPVLLNKVLWFHCMCFIWRLRVFAQMLKYSGEELYRIYAAPGAKSVHIWGFMFTFFSRNVCGVNFKCFIMCRICKRTGAGSGPLCF